MRLYLKWTIGGLKTYVEARELASFIEARWTGTRPLGSPPGEVYTGRTAVAGRFCEAKIPGISGNLSQADRKSVV